MSDKKKRRPRREFDASFKADAVKLVQTGERPISLIAKELDITETSLRAWVRQAEIDAEAAQNGPLTSAERLWA
jgi:transposase